jgi:hypothetical protein
MSAKIAIPSLREVPMFVNEDGTVHPGFRPTPIMQFKDDANDARRKAWLAFKSLGFHWPSGPTASKSKRRPKRP